MVTCPECGFENIEGVDQCESCQQSLTSLSKHQPSTNLEQGLMKDPIKVLEPRTPVSVKPDEPVGQVLDLLIAKGIGCVLVVEDETLVGIFSERDVLLRLNINATELRDRPIREFMTETPGTLEMNDKIAFAVHKMALGDTVTYPSSRPVVPRALSLFATSCAMPPRSCKRPRRQALDRTRDPLARRHVSSRSHISSRSIV